MHAMGDWGGNVVLSRRQRGRVGTDKCSLSVSRWPGPCEGLLWAKLGPFIRKLHFSPTGSANSQDRFAALRALVGPRGGGVPVTCHGR